MDVNESEIENERIVIFVRWIVTGMLVEDFIEVGELHVQIREERARRPHACRESDVREGILEGDLHWAFDVTNDRSFRGRVDDFDANLCTLSLAASAAKNFDDTSHDTTGRAFVHDDVDDDDEWVVQSNERRDLKIRSIVNRSRSRLRRRTSRATHIHVSPS